MPFGSAASAAIRRAPAGRSRRGPQGSRISISAAADAADLSDLFEGLFGGGGRAAAAAAARSAASASARGPPQKGADVAYRLKVPFEDAVALKPQRITLGDGKTIDLKLPQGLEDGTKIRLAGKGEEGPAGRGDAIVTIEIAPHRFFTREGNNIRLELPVTLKEAVLGAKVKVPTPEGPVMLTIPKGTTLGQGAAPQGPGLHRQGRQARRPAGHRRDRRARRRCRAAAVRRRLERRRQPARGPRRLEPPLMRDISPQSPEARRKRLASMRAAFGTEVEEKLKPQPDRRGR